MRLLLGLSFCAGLWLLPSPSVSAADPIHALSLDVQHTRPTDIVSAATRAADDHTIVSGLVRHRGPPGRNGIFGHVVAEVQLPSGDETRIDVPLVHLANPRKTAAEARFSFDLPADLGKPVIVHLRYVEAHGPAPG